MKKACLAILLLALLTSPLSALAEMTISPLDDSYYYEHWFAGADINAHIALGQERVAFYESPMDATLVLADPNLPGIYLALFTIFNRLPVDLSQEESILYALEAIGCAPENAEYTVLDDSLSGATMLRVRETRGALYSEHLLALKDGWVLNAMLQPTPESGPGGATTSGSPDLITDAARNWQLQLLRSALSGPLSLRKQHYAVPGSGIALALPEAYYLTTSFEDANLHYFSVYPIKSGPQGPAVMGMAQALPALDGVTLAADNPQAVRALASLVLGSAPAQIDAQPVPMEGHDVLTYQQGETRHLIALKDGWGINLQAIPNDIYEWETVCALQDALMRMALDGTQAALPTLIAIGGLTRVEDSLWIPLNDHILAVDIPSGFAPELIAEEDGFTVFFLHDVQGGQMPFQAIIMNMGAETAAYLAEDDQLEMELLTLSIGESPLDDAAIIPNGPLGHPALHGTHPAEGYAAYYVVLDGAIVELRYSPEDAGATDDPLRPLNLRLL